MPPKKKKVKSKLSQKQKQTQIVTVNVTAPDKPRRKRSPRAKKQTEPVKPKIDQFGFRPHGSGGGGLLTPFAGQAEQFRQVIYTPQSDVGGSIKSLEKSIESLSRSGGSQSGKPPIAGVGSRDDESDLGDPEPQQQEKARQLSAGLRRAGLKPSKMSPIAEGGGMSLAEVKRQLERESSTKKAQDEMMRQQYNAAEEQEPFGS